MLVGGEGSDTYVLGLSDAGTTIVETSTGVSEIDTLEFASGILPTETRLLRDGMDLLVAAKNGAAQFTVKDYFATGDHKVEAMRFADGTTWTSGQITSRIEAGTVNAMTGTSADDTFTIDNTGDTVTELANGGTDTIRSSVSYALPNNVERLVLTGIGNINARGNANNTVSYLYGNDGNNRVQRPGRDLPAGWREQRAHVRRQGPTTRTGAGRRSKNVGEGNDTIVDLYGGNFHAAAKHRKIHRVRQRHQPRVAVRYVHRQPALQFS
jgi:hypothetical protein